MPDVVPPLLLLVALIHLLPVVGMGGRARLESLYGTAVRFTDLPNVGPAMARDLERIGIRRPADLAGRDPLDLYDKLCSVTRARHDPCVLDVFMSVTHVIDGGRARPWWAFTAERKRR